MRLQQILRDIAMSNEAALKMEAQMKRAIVLEDVDENTSACPHPRLLATRRGPAGIENCLAFAFVFGRTVCSPID